MASSSALPAFPDAGFAHQLGAPAILGIVMNRLSRKVRKQAKTLNVRYEFWSQ